MLGCVGYQNHQHFLQFAFHGGLWMSAHCLFIFFHMEAIDFSAGDYMFFASGWVLAAFAWVVFFMVKAVNRVNQLNKKPEVPAPPPAPSAQEKLLAEIRDLLAKQSAK